MFRSLVRTLSSPVHQSDPHVFCCRSLRVEFDRMFRIDFLMITEDIKLVSGSDGRIVGCPG